MVRHSQNVSRNASWKVNGTGLFGSLHWNGANGTSGKIVHFPRSEVCSRIFVFQFFKPILRTNFRPGPPVSGKFFNPQLYLSGYGFCPHVSGKSGILIGQFFNPLSRVEIFEWAMNQESCGRLIRIFFSSTEVTRSRQVFFTVNIQDDAERNVIPSLLLKLQFYSCTVKRNYCYCTLQLCQAVARTVSFDVGKRN